MSKEMIKLKLASAISLTLSCVIIALAVFLVFNRDYVLSIARIQTYLAVITGWIVLEKPEKRSEKNKAYWFKTALMLGLVAVGFLLMFDGVLSFMSNDVLFGFLSIGIGLSTVLWFAKGFIFKRI